jgi:glutamate formiminotransferase
VALIECVPNFSEGRDPLVLEALRASIASVAHVALLHQTADPDHHRSVYTFAGDPDAVCEAAYQAVAIAAQHIDLSLHSGVHPRMGATDVLPLVPLEGISLEDCAELARQLGKRIGRTLHLPVYLYEAAATRPERVNLADVRRGGYEILRDNIALPERTPDFGPSHVGPAGACIVGARNLLIAFNVFLQTDDVMIAQDIARRLRAANGGYPGVKALGLLVEGKAQVSMNITQVWAVSLQHLVDDIYQQARAAGTDIHHSELIGLMPWRALTSNLHESDLISAAHSLRLHDFTPNRVLEVALRNAGYPVALLGDA